MAEIGEALREVKRSTALGIVIAATVRPQDCELALRSLESASGSVHGAQFILVMGPLFLREGTMLDDLQMPPFILTGTFDGKPNAASLAWAEALGGLVASGAKLGCPILCVQTGVASIVKLSSNAFHAMKVCFANEVGRICRASNVDGLKAMSVFVQDRLLNVSTLYLRPGFAFGGSCLEKDIVGLLSTADLRGSGPLQLLQSLREANVAHLRRAANLIQKEVESIRESRVGILGLTFKAGTDDMRSSPAIELVKLLPRGYEIHAFDPDLPQTPTLTGENKSRWQETLGNQSIRIAGSVSDITSRCDVLVIAKSASIDMAELGALLNERHVLIDLVGETQAATPYACRIERLV